MTELVEGKHASLAQVRQDDAERVTGRLVEVELEECQRDDGLRVQFQVMRDRVADVMYRPNTQLRG
jgi:ribosomal protein S3AE